MVTINRELAAVQAAREARAETAAAKVLGVDLETRALGMTLAEVVFRVSNGTVPQGITEQQARIWVRDTFKAHYRAILDQG